MDQDNNTLETRTIWTTIIANLLFSILAFGFAFQTHSDAIVLDGVFLLVAFAVSLLSLFVARLVTHPGTRAFPFGHAIFEPMLNLTKGLMLATVLAYAIFSAIAKLGRLVYLQLYLMADADRPAKLTLSEQDRLRQDLYDLLLKEFGKLVLGVVFTTDLVWSGRPITSATLSHHGLAR